MTTHQDDVRQGGARPLQPGFQGIVRHVGVLEVVAHGAVPRAQHVAQVRHRAQHRVVGAEVRDARNLRTLGLGFRIRVGVRFRF